MQEVNKSLNNILTFCMLSNYFFMLLLSSAEFFPELTFFQKFFQEPYQGLFFSPFRDNEPYPWNWYFFSELPFSKNSFRNPIHGVFFHHFGTMTHTPLELGGFFYRIDFFQKFFQEPYQGLFFFTISGQ